MSRSQGDDRGATPRRAALRRSGRPFGRRPEAPRSDADRINAIAAGAHVPVEDVLRDVADFRLALETDMIIAAAAFDAATPDLLGDVLDGERAELATFHDRVLGRLADAAASDELALRRERRAPGGSRVQRAAAVAAVVAAVLGAGRVATLRADRPTTTEAANSAALAVANVQYADFSTAMTGTSTGAVNQAAFQLHQTLKTLITQHAGDPEIAQQTARMLQAEISLLEGRGGDASSQVLDQARRLVTLLQTQAPPRVRASVAPILAVVAKPKPSPSPTAKQKPSPSPTPSPSATKTSQSPDKDNPLP
jgi:hypothetical protein